MRIVSSHFFISSSRVFGSGPASGCLFGDARPREFVVVLMTSPVYLFCLAVRTLDTEMKNLMPTHRRKPFVTAVAV